MKAVRGLIMLPVAGVVAASALALPATAPRNFRADLTAANQVPAPAHVPHHAGGRFTGSLKGRTLSWSLRYHTLTGKGTSAHIHAGVVGQAGPVLVSLCSPCDGTVGGESRLTPAEIAAIVRGRAYVDIHTARNPNGEIRGQIYLRKPS